MTSTALAFVVLIYRIPYCSTCRRSGDPRLTISRKCRPRRRKDRQQEEKAKRVSTTLSSVVPTRRICAAAAAGFQRVEHGGEALLRRFLIAKVIVMVVGDDSDDRNGRRSLGKLRENVARDRVPCDAVLIGPIDIRPQVRIHAPSGSTGEQLGEVHRQWDVDEFQVAANLPEFSIRPMRIRYRSGPNGPHFRHRSSGSGTGATPKSELGENLENRIVCRKGARPKIQGCMANRFAPQWAGFREQSPLLLSAQIPIMREKTLRNYAAKPSISRDAYAIPGMLPPFLIA